MKNHVERWSENLVPKEWQQLTCQLQKYEDLFSKNDYDVGSTDTVQHHVPLGPGTIKLNNLYRKGSEEEKKIGAQVQKL